MRKICFTIISFLVFASCENKAKSVSEVKAHSSSKADSIIYQSQLAHGVNEFEIKTFQLNFRDKIYRFTFQNNGFKFNRIDTANGDIINDFYSEAEFWRIKNGQEIELLTDGIEKYKSSINSVIYFASLPYKLSDVAVISNYVGQQNINAQEYDVVEVRFKEENGGEDHDDIFYYWFHTKTHLIDFLAYQYQTDGGGVRFRKAYNRTKVGGVVFQDYINYEVPVGTPLGEIPILFEQDSLKELSRIENTDILVLP